MDSSSNFKETLGDRIRAATTRSEGLVLSTEQATTILGLLGRINPDLAIAGLTGGHAVLECAISPPADGHIVIRRLTAVIGGIPISLRDAVLPAKPGVVCLRLVQTGVAIGGRPGTDDTAVELLTVDRPDNGDLAIARISDDPALELDEFFWPPLAHALADERSERALVRLRDAASDLVPASVFAGPVSHWPLVLTAVLLAARHQGEVGIDRSLLDRAWRAQRIDHAVRELLRAFDLAAGLPAQYRGPGGAIWSRYRWLCPARQLDPNCTEERTGQSWAVLLRPRAGAVLPLTLTLLNDEGGRERVLNLKSTDDLRFAMVSGSRVSVACQEERRSDLLAAVYVSDSQNKNDFGVC